jgi:aspartate/methionine/tyrosine aminotransferase
MPKSLYYKILRRKGITSPSMPDHIQAGENMPKISSRTDAVPLSGIREMMDLAATIPGVLRLEIGDPNFQTPRAITEAAFDWASRNRVGYPPNSGLMELRKAVAAKVGRVNGIACGVENVNVTVGATGALYLALLATIEPGMDVLVPDPGWAGYPAMVGLAGGRVSPYPLSADSGFQLDVGAVERAITGRTGAIIVNSPGNPTGVLFARDELRKLLDLAARRDIWIIADECYDEIVFEGRHHAIGAMEAIDSSRVLSAFSFSKTYAMTGWRLGYLVAPAAVSRHVTRMQAAAVSAASAVAQAAGIAALAGSHGPVAEMVEAYRRRRDSAMALLDAAGIGYVRPDGALYIMVDIRGTGMPSKDVALALLRDCAVCTTPGSAFGAECEGFLRISLASADADLVEGLGRLATYVRARATAAA